MTRTVIDNQPSNQTLMYVEDLEYDAIHISIGSKLGKYPGKSVTWHFDIHYLSFSYRLSKLFGLFCI